MKWHPLVSSLLLSVTLATPSSTPLPPEPQDVLRGTLSQLAAGRVDGALPNFHEDFSTAAWRTTFTALRGLRIGTLEPYRTTFWAPDEREYKVTYDVPHGTLTLKNRAYVLLAFNVGTWRITRWEKTPPPRLTIATNRLVPNTGTTLRGVGFTPNATLDVRLEMNEEFIALGKTRADAEGRVSWSFRVPARNGPSLLLARQARLVVSNGDVRVTRTAEFAPTMTPRELPETYAAPDLTVRFPSGYRLSRNDDALQLTDPKGRGVLRGLILPRLPATDGLSVTDYAAQLGNLYGDRLGTTVESVASRNGAPNPTFNVRFTGGDSGLLMTCATTATRWVLWRTPQGYEALLDGVAKSSSVTCS